MCHPLAACWEIYLRLWLVPQTRPPGGIRHAGDCSSFSVVTPKVEVSTLPIWFLPTSALIVSGIIPILIFQWQGFEVQNGAGEEMENPQRDVPRSIIRAGITAVIAYAAFLITILLVLPKGQLSNVGSFLAAFQVCRHCAWASRTPDGLDCCAGFCCRAGLQWWNLDYGCRPYLCYFST